MSVIEGSSVSVKTMADGTLRLSIDIDPVNAQAAFALFGAPGRAVALAALKDGAGAVKEPEVRNRTSDAPKGGEWAKLAGIWCNDPDFWEWANSVHNYMQVKDAFSAADFMRIESGISSRAVLDNDPEALKRFNAEIRYPFMKWMQARGIQK